MARYMRIEGDETPRPERPEHRSDAYLRGCRLPKVGERVGELVVTGEPSSGPITARMSAIDAAGEPLVLELLQPRVAAHPDASVRFAARARAISSLAHEALPQARTTGLWCGIPFVAFTPIPGPSLDEVLSDNAGMAMPAPIAAAIGIAIADALATLHSARDPQGYPVEAVHGRLDPSRVILPARGGVALDATLAPPAESLSGGAREASISYAAPEQLVSSQVDARSDIYSLGAVLYELFTGQRAFDGDASAVWKARLAHARPRRVGAVRREIPPFVEALIDACLDADPARRPASALEVASTLRVAFRVAPPASPVPSLEAPQLAPVSEPERDLERSDTALEMRAITTSPALAAEEPALGIDIEVESPADSESHDATMRWDDSAYRGVEQSGERPSRPMDDWGGATEVLHATPAHSADEVVTPEPVELDAQASVGAAARTIRMDAIDVAALLPHERASLPAQQAAADASAIDAATVEPPLEPTTRRWADRLFAVAVMSLLVATVVTWVLADL